MNTLTKDCVKCLLDLKMNLVCVLLLLWYKQLRVQAALKSLSRQTHRSAPRRNQREQIVRLARDVCRISNHSLLLYNLPFLWTLDLKWNMVSTLTEQRRLREFESWILKQIFRPENWDQNEKWRRLHNGNIPVYTGRLI